MYTRRSLPRPVRVPIAIAFCCELIDDVFVKEVNEREKVPLCLGPFYPLLGTPKKEEFGACKVRCENVTEDGEPSDSEGVRGRNYVYDRPKKYISMWLSGRLEGIREI